VSTSTEPGAYVWRRPAYYSYRTCGVYPYLWAVDEQDQQRGFHTVNGLKAELFRRGYGITKPKPNGVFGQSMRQMVIDFQIDEGLKIDGTVGPITARRLARDLIQLEQLKQGIPHNYLA
jgi:peptidoglycan hydrolase-like protein with peptidoglycan-binding domain